MNKIARSIFKILKFSPPVSNAFPLTYTKLPLDENLLLVFKRVLDTNFESGHTNLKYIKNKVPIENFFKTFLKLVVVVVRSFCFGQYFSPFGINRQKQSLLRALLLSPQWYK
jgi:hypothetical protein